MKNTRWMRFPLLVLVVGGLIIDNARAASRFQISGTGSLTTLNIAGGGRATLNKTEIGPKLGGMEDDLGYTFGAGVEVSVVPSVRIGLHYSRLFASAEYGSTAKYDLPANFYDAQAVWTPLTFGITKIGGAVSLGILDVRGQIHSSDDLPSIPIRGRTLAATFMLVCLIPARVVDLQFSVGYRVSEVPAEDVEYGRLPAGAYENGLDYSGVDLSMSVLWPLPF